MFFAVLVTKKSSMMRIARAFRGFVNNKKQKKIRIKIRCVAKEEKKV